MIIALERTKFTYLYKYSKIRVDINQLIDKSMSVLKEMINIDFNELIQLFDSAIPLFEQDHEIILLEIEKSTVHFHKGVLISFDSIQSIYPLTQTGLQLLEGKINDDFIVENPVFEDVIITLKRKRSIAFRRETALKLISNYNLDALLPKNIFSLIESSIEKNLLEKNTPQAFNSYLDNLIGYNKTPAYIPDGNVEYICKVGAIAMKYHGGSEEIFTNGPFYKSSIKYKSQLNSPSLLTSYLDFITLEDNELQFSIDTMVKIISKDHIGVDMFKVSYFFLAFKSILNKHENNIELINNEILALIENDKESASFVLALLGFTFSIESIYEGLHKISNAPLLKSTRSKILATTENRIRINAVIQNQIAIETSESEQENNSLSEITQTEESKSEIVLKNQENATVSIKKEVEVNKKATLLPETISANQENNILSESTQTKTSKSEIVLKDQKNTTGLIKNEVEVNEEATLLPLTTSANQENNSLSESTQTEESKSDIVLKDQENTTESNKKEVEVNEEATLLPVTTSANQENNSLSELKYKGDSKSEIVLIDQENTTGSNKKEVEVNEEATLLPVITSANQENNSLSELRHKEESKHEVVLHDSVNNIAPMEKIGIVVDEVIQVPIQKLSDQSESIDNCSNIVESEIAQSLQDNLNETKSSTEDKEAYLKEKQMEKLTVLDFKVFLSNEFNKNKQKMWFDIIAKSFSDTQIELTQEILFEKLNSEPHIMSTLLKSKKDEELIKSFFNI
jgi:hypothetical protein